MPRTEIEIVNKVETLKNDYFGVMINQMVGYLSFENAQKFLLPETTKKEWDESDHEQAIVSCLFIQMSIELSLKAFLIKECGIKTILNNQYQHHTIESIFEAFERNTLQTKRYEDLKNYIKSHSELTWFNNNHFNHLDKFQRFRNKLVHLNLSLDTNDLLAFQYELIYAIVHLLIPLLTEISFEFETPTEFYKIHLDKDQYEELINFPPYIEEMEKLSKEFTGLAYECTECFNRAFSPISEICYCCNLNFRDAAEYATCVTCTAPKSVVFDYLNIKHNENTINGLCLNCGEKQMVFKCADCEKTTTFYSKKELANTCYSKCLYS